MGRRNKKEKRDLLPDPKYKNLAVAKFINMIMKGGKRSTAQQVVYGAFEVIREKTQKDPIGIFSQAIRNVSPLLEVKSKRVGGANYQVPIEVRGDRRVALAMRWIKQFARSKKGKPMSIKLAEELIDASNKQGAAIKKREDTHRMAEANKAFAHFAW